MVRSWRIYCETEKKEYTVEDQSKIFKCPADDTHTTDRSKITEVLANNVREVEIGQENTTLGRYLKVKGYNLSIPLGIGWSTQSITWPTDIAVISAKVFMAANNVNDRVDVYINKHTTIGIITSNVATNDTVITVNDTVMQYIHVGFEMTLTDGVNTDELGNVKSMDFTNNQITVENAAVHNFTAYSTSVKMSVHIVESVTLPTYYDTIDVGYTNLGTSFAPAGTQFQVEYYNSTGLAKNFNIIINYYY